MQKKINFINKILHILSILWFIFIIFHVITAGKIFLTSLFGSVPTFVFILIPVFFLLFITLKKEKKIYYFIIPVLSFLLGFTQFDINIYKNNPVETNTSEYKQIKIFNWNTFCWDLKKDKDQFYKFLKMQNADIYVLQEYLYFVPNWQNITDIKIDPDKIFKICTFIPGFIFEYMKLDDDERIKKEFPGYYYSTDLQFVIISRFPILKSYLDKSEQYAVTDIDIYGRIVRIFNVHMLLHIEPSNPFIYPFYEAMNRRFIARKVGFDNLYNDLNNNSITDYIIAGDFNATKAMGHLNGLYKNHVDAIKYSKDWFSLNFKFFGFRLWRLDYIFVPKQNDNILIKSLTNLDDKNLSDHKPQSLILDIKAITR